jgi:hypothetical protein
VDPDSRQTEIAVCAALPAVRPSHTVQAMSNARRQIKYQPSNYDDIHIFGRGSHMLLHHKWPTGMTTIPKVSSRMLNVKSVARRHFQFRCRHWWPDHCIFSPRRLRQFCRRHRLMACIESRTLTINGSNPARDVNNSGMLSLLKKWQKKSHYEMNSYQVT